MDSATVARSATKSRDPQKQVPSARQIGGKRPGDSPLTQVGGESSDSAPMDERSILLIDDPL